MKVCLIPGLGYDGRIFKHLDLEGYEVINLHWIEPKVDEQLHEYAQRLFAPIKELDEKIILIGHSLGGVVAQEIASVHPIEKVILISSIKSRKELSLAFKLIQPFRLEKFFTKEISLKTVKFWGTGHGFETEEEKELFRSMVGSQTNTYLQWALRELSSWQEPKISSETQLIHIHGTKDKTLPYRLVNKPDFTIEKGSHICVLKKSEEVSAIIKTILMQHLSVFFYDPSKESINTATTFECSLEGEKLRVKNSSVNCLFSNLDSKQFDESYNNFFKHLNLDFSPIKSGNKTYQLSEKEQNALIQVLITNWIYYYTINDLPIVVKKADFESPSVVDQVLFVLDKKYGRNTPVSLSLGAKILRQQEKDYRTTVKARRKYYDR